jgi:hypothetical protein
MTHNPLSPDGHFMCAYTKIDPNDPEKVHTLILKEEESGKFSGE